jgi:hypothetical protein
LLIRFRLFYFKVFLGSTPAVQGPELSTVSFLQKGCRCNRCFGHAFQYDSPLAALHHKSHFKAAPARSCLPYSSRTT